MRHTSIASVVLALALFQGCARDTAPAPATEIPEVKFPIDLIHGIVEYTPGNKRELSAKEINEWKIILDRANRFGYRPIQNSTKRAVKASYKFSDSKGKTLLELDQFEDGIVSIADKYFLWE